MLDNLFKGVNFLIWLVGIGTLLAGAIGVSNINMMHGSNNSAFKEQLRNSKEKFECALEMLKELETIDLPDVIKS